jgi:hypothetical protein
VNVLFLTILAFGLNLSDFAGFSREWQCYRSPTRCLQYDYDHSGIVDLYDLELFIDGWIMSATVTVSGLESPFDALNGIYTESGEFNGRPRYVFGEDAAIGWSGSVWFLVDASAPENIWTGNDGTYPDGDFVANEETEATGTATVEEYIEEVFGAPVITATAGSDSITVTVDGYTGALHTVLYKPIGALAWIEGGTVSDDGDVVISGLSAGNYYVIAYSSNDGGNSTPSNLLYVSVSSGGDYIEEAVYSLITSDAAIVNAVSSRVYPQTIPQTVLLPSIRYNLISSGREHNTVLAEDMVEARFQIDVISGTYKQVRQVAEVVRLALDKYSGTVGNVTIQCIHLINEMDYYSDATGNDQLRRFGKTQEYTVWYNQALS